MEESPHTCLNCGTVFEGNFCPQCGQASDIRRFTWRSIPHNFFEAFFNVDEGFLHTVIELFTRPGFMIREYLEGHRKPYFPPFQMLFATSAIFVILIQLFIPEFWKMITMADSSQVTNVYMAETAQKLQTGEGDLFSLFMLKANKLRLLLTPESLPSVVSNLLEITANFIMSTPALALLVLLPFLCGAMKWVFRSTPYGGQMNTPEYVLTVVYMSCQLILLEIPFMILSLICGEPKILSIFPCLILILWCYGFRQQFNLTWRKALLFSVYSIMVAYTIIIGLSVSAAFLCAICVLVLGL